MFKKNVHIVFSDMKYGVRTRATLLLNSYLIPNLFARIQDTSHGI